MKDSGGGKGKGSALSLRLGNPLHMLSSFCMIFFSNRQIVKTNQSDFQPRDCDKLPFKRCTVAKRKSCEEL